MNEPRRRKPAWPDLPATKGLVVRHRSTGYVGKIERCTPDWVTIRDQDGRSQTLRNERGAFSVNGSSVTLVPAKSPNPPTGQAMTALAALRYGRTLAWPDRA